MGKAEAGYNKADKASCCRSVRRRHRLEMVRRSHNLGGHSRILDGRTRRSHNRDDVSIHPYTQDKNIGVARQLDKVQEFDFVLACKTPSFLCQCMTGKSGRRGTAAQISWLF